MSSPQSPRVSGKRKVFKILTRMPVLRDLVFIVNGYVYEGDAKAILELAPARLWASRLLPKFLLAVSLGFWFVYEFTCGFIMIPDNATKVPDILLGVFPNLLGFGIGVYALIFAFPTSFFSRRQANAQLPAGEASGSSERQSNPTSPNLVNADMAYPLVILAIAVMYGAVTFFFVSIPALIWGATLIAYSFFLVIELISLIYFSAYRVIDGKGRGGE